MVNPNNSRAYLFFFVFSSNYNFYIKLRKTLLFTGDMDDWAIKLKYYLYRIHNIKILNGAINEKYSC